MGKEKVLEMSEAMEKQCKYLVEVYVEGAPVLQKDKDKFSISLRDIVSFLKKVLYTTPNRGFIYNTGNHILLLSKYLIAIRLLY